MHRRMLLLFALSLICPTILAEDFSEGAKLFALKVKPLLAEKCLACHGDKPEDMGGDLDMRTRESLLAGGDTFERDVVVTGDGENSGLYRVVAHLEEGYEMPPKLADRLAQEQTWWIRDWITAGADWPEDAVVAKIQDQYAEGEQVRTSKALSQAWQERRYETDKLWAYRPLRKISIPTDANPVDWFLDRKRKAANIQPAGDATATEMLRRMSFGLTGLPPRPPQIASFEKAYQSDPKKAVIDFAEDLMTSQHYGEQFAQHWLDVTRYADTAGFANDYARPHAWRYRDYVVRSFNADKPFDQCVKEQLAGDEIDPQDPEMLVATGFLRMGPWEQTGMSVFKETRQLWLDDVTDSVGQTFLGHAMQCAKCHDHKFDPVPTRDYYRMMAVFSTTQFAEREAPFLPQESQANFAEVDAWAKKKVAYYQQDLDTLTAKINERLKKETTAAKVGDNGLDPGDEASKARVGKNKTRHTIELDRTQPFAFSVYTGKTVAKKNIQGRQTIPKNPWKRGEFDSDVIFEGGDIYSEGPAVVPGALSAAESLSELPVSEFATGQGKRRLGLANWIVNPQNPLTARVIVNRVWAWHFGKGIAGNPNNFGGTGELPTHPELLDYLAGDFMENGWSIKRLNRQIVASAAYRRSSRHPNPARLAELDPGGRLYATFAPRRLAAEELRDAMLVASGEMNNAIGGVPVRPDINLEVAYQPRQIMGGTASVYEPDALPEQRNRRSLYAERVRGLRAPFFETFNQPGANDSCELRETSTVAPQALTMMNAEEVQDRALSLAHQLLKKSKNDPQTIRQLFLRTLSRKPTEKELKACLREWATATAEEKRLSPKPKVFAATLERTVMAEKTGEPYTFIEHLPAYETYVPDLQRSDVDAKTRGLSHICLVIFNLNEFAYLD